MATVCLGKLPARAHCQKLRGAAFQPGSLGGTFPAGGTLVSPVCSASGQPVLQPITTPEDDEVIARVEAMLPELCVRSLAGSYREGTVRCLMGLVETHPDRPAGISDIARGQCRSLSEGPNRRRAADSLPSARRAPMARRP